MESFLNQRLNEVEARSGSSEEGAQVLKKVAELEKALAAEKEKNATLNRLLLDESFKNDRLRRELKTA